MAPRVAAVTMAFDEAAFLPVWGRHYARQVGADRCYVIDHGSTVPIVVPPGVNVVRIPRSPHDDARRAKFIGDFVSSLLAYYDWVLHSDVDELVLADPTHFRNLPEFCAVAPAATVTAVGLDVQQVTSLELPLDLARPIGLQRGWVRFSSALCKPVLTRRRVAWAPGFHTADQPVVFGALLLFHLRWADHGLGLDRLQKTRTMPWADQSCGAHQRLRDADWTTLFDGMAALPRQPAAALTPNGPRVAPWVARTTASAASGSLDLGINAGELWAIPPHFRARL